MAKTQKTNPFADRICNVIPSRNVERDWSFEQALTSQALKTPKGTPPGVDLRAAWWNIGDQGPTGACVGWASADGVMRYLMVKAGRMAQPAHLAKRFTWMAAKEIDPFTRPSTFIDSSGTSLKASMDILRNFGIVPESVVPFKITNYMYLGNENAFYIDAATRRIAYYINLLKNLSNWRLWLATKGPILAGLGVDATWDNATATNGKLDVYKPNTYRGGHAVCVVGYTTDNRFIIRNSWGTGWGDKGFGYASEAYINAGFFNESYGAVL